MGLIIDLFDKKGFELVSSSSVEYTENLIYKCNNKTIQIIIEILKEKWWRDAMIRPFFDTKFLSVSLYSALNSVSGYDELKTYIDQEPDEKPDINKIKYLIKKENDNKPIINGLKTFYIKTSPNQKRCCIITEDTMLKALDDCLNKQEKINELIKQQEKYSYVANRNYLFKGNLWYCPPRKKYQSSSYKNTLYLITGLLRSDDSTIWLKGEDVASKVVEIS